MMIGQLHVAVGADGVQGGHECRAAHEDGVVDRHQVTAGLDQRLHLLDQTLAFMDLIDDASRRGGEDRGIDEDAVKAPIQSSEGAGLAEEIGLDEIGGLDREAIQRARLPGDLQEAAITVQLEDAPGLPGEGGDPEAAGVREGVQNGLACKMSQLPSGAGSGYQGRSSNPA